MPLRAGRLCVYCGKHPAAPEWGPFCSERCKVLDLARWVDGEYRIAGEPVSSDAEPDESSPHSPNAAPKPPHA
jgi:endogenous inhibitor of DNA gyrase (YacG/DUF329 family)